MARCLPSISGEKPDRLDSDVVPDIGCAQQGGLGGCQNFGGVAEMFEQRAGAGAYAFDHV
jgi:hypothetical protein